MDSIFSKVTELTGAAFEVEEAAGSWLGGEEYSFKVSVNAENADTYNKALQAISYVAEAARQDAYIENLGKVDKSEVSSQSLVDGTHTPAVTIPFTKALSQREIALIQKAFMDESTDELPLDATVTKDGITFSMPTWLLEYDKNENIDSKYTKYLDFYNNWSNKIQEVFNKLKEDDRLNQRIGENWRREYEESRFHSANSTEGTERNYSSDRDNILRQWGKSQEDEGILRQSEKEEIIFYSEGLTAIKIGLTTLHSTKSHRNMKYVKSNTNK